MNGRISTFDEFWPFYISQHLNPANHRLHMYGTSIALVLGIAAVAARNPFVGASAVVVPYAFAWWGHFFFEKNVPATFRNPWWSLRADFRMYRLTLRGEMGAEILLLTKELRAFKP